MSAVRGATATWGGQYLPLISPADGDAALDFARSLDVDALYAIDDDDSARNLAMTRGFRWHARSESGPFDDGDGYWASQLMTVEPLIESLPEAKLPLRYTWAEDDPLRGSGSMRLLELALAFGRIWTAGRRSCRSIETQR
jgi:hypothetical protein